MSSWTCPAQNHLGTASKMLLLVTLVLVPLSTYAAEVDPNGYVLYCPCMGRFGNQAEHFLGALGFIKGLNRTIVLPPWVEYPVGSVRSHQVPFDTYFRVDAIQEFHRAMTMEEFMKELAPTLWPKGSRTVFCYTSRQRNTAKGDTCDAKDGNPFGPFWDTFDVDFDKSEFYGPLYYDTYDPKMKKAWQDKYPPSLYPVIAFTGAPASFPADARNIPLAKYLMWSDKIKYEAEMFVKEYMQGSKFVGIHLRHGSDWARACEHTTGTGQRNLFASAQCLGYRMEYGELTHELCFPSEKTVLRQIRETVRKTKASMVFVATDHDPMIPKIEKYLKGKVRVVVHHPPNPHVDLAILSMADHYIANCVSSFSAVATRYRQTHGNKPTSFWAFKKPKDEL